MKKGRISVKVLAILGALVISLSLFSCGDDNGDDETTPPPEPNVDVTINHSGADGLKVYLSIVEAGASCLSEPVAKTNGTFSGTTIELSVYVPDATYDVCANIDVDGSGISPNGGDYLGTSTNLVVSGTGTDTIDELDFATLLADNVTGVVGFTGQGGKTVYAAVVPIDGDPSTDALAIGSGVLSGGTASIDFSPGVADGLYDVLAFIDMDNSGINLDVGPTTGDYIVDSVPLTVSGGAGIVTIIESDFVSVTVIVNFTGQDTKEVVAVIVPPGGHPSTDGVGVGYGNLASGTVEIALFPTSGPGLKIPNGNYDAYAIIDVDGSGNPGGPNSGDYFTFTGVPFTVNGSTWITLNQGDFTQIP